jgi:ribosomal protein S18 acetylase RimI-like enzyme
MAKNIGARALYEKLGFVVYRETVVRVVERVA